MITKITKMWLFLMAVLMLINVSAVAVTVTSVPVNNGSFETDVVADGSTLVQTPTGWERKMFGTNSVFNPTGDGSSFFNSAVPDGNNVYTGGTVKGYKKIAQLVPVPGGLLNGQIYTCTLDLASSSLADGGAFMQLTLTGAGVELAKLVYYEASSGDWQTLTVKTAPLNYTYLPGPYNDIEIFIWIYYDAAIAYDQVYIDNIALSLSYYVLVSESNGNTVVYENSAGGSNTDTYSIVLEQEPNSNVAILVDANDPNNRLNLGAGAGQPITLTFTPLNWNTPQVVTVTAVDDSFIQGTQVIQINHSVSSTTDPNYAGYKILPVRVTIIDDECGSWGYHSSDLNQDCYVDFDDFAWMAQDWLKCTDPHDMNCTQP